MNTHIPASSTLARAEDFNDVPAWAGCWVPVAVLLFVYLCGFVLEETTYWKYFVGEMSWFEIPTVLVLGVAIMTGIRAYRDSLLFGNRVLAGWLLLGTAGCFFFAGEEASWGQWYLRWTTPEAWQALNDQNETNLHNMAGIGFLFDQVPRLLLTLGAAVGGIVVPIALKWRGQTLLPSRLWYWIWPTAATLPVAVIAVFLVRIDRTVGALTGQPWPRYDMRTGELKELYLAYFLLLYLWSLQCRLRQLRNALGVKRVAEATGSGGITEPAGTANSRRSA